MPTELRSSQPERDPRGGENLAATAAILAIVTLCLWLIYAFAEANAAVSTSGGVSTELKGNAAKDDPGLSFVVSRTRARADCQHTDHSHHRAVA
jgi:predicted anti-sigma-YlaC factor YlaD